MPARKKKTTTRKKTPVVKKATTRKKTTTKKKVVSKKKSTRGKTWELTVREVRVWKCHVKATTPESAASKLKQSFRAQPFPYTTFDLEVEDVQQIKN